MTVDRWIATAVIRSCTGQRREVTVDDCGLTSDSVRRALATRGYAQWTLESVRWNLVPETKGQRR